ncbi:DUF4124 domain-containing protein [Nitrosomonas marina]|uniref:DUF4124 domain-containing protein n=1 Tax=Nitrosomonas marina TaxID=917 RepID=A0A1H8FSN6_9PROT|nr:DUF4124 domain-containing protein [Nitrosomonas marina]SEN34118.1 protein of unknown function [Nitrosomonas marina]
MSKPGIVIFLVCMGLYSLPELVAGSAIYKYVDQDGNITFTNRPIKGGEKLQSSQQSPQSSRKTVLHAPKQSYNSTVQIQSKRELKRREILEHELATEMVLFTDTRKNLSLLNNDAELQLQKEKIQHLRSKMLRHKNNIKALKKELTKL